MGASAALIGGIAVPANFVVGMRRVAEIPSDSVVDLGVSYGEPSGVGSGGTFEVPGKRGKVGRRAVARTAWLRTGWGGVGSNVGSWGAGSSHGDDVLFKGGGFPGNGIIFVIADLEREEDGRVHEGDMFSIGRSREVTVVEVFVTIVNPGVPRGWLADTAVDAEEHLDAFVVGEDARASRGQGEEVVEAGIEGRYVEFVIGGFQRADLVEGLGGK